MLLANRRTSYWPVTVLIAVPEKMLKRGNALAHP